jgi:diaminohydroxyphosphoribosylaminopyrimidine deaminase/5-amino-6-(5-phosphoribosylamino)uracil reductase
LTLTHDDQRFLERALVLAERGRGHTSPNPIVGALIVREGEVVGEGFHAGAGTDHAEVVALKDARQRGTDGVRDATIYVTLEPCCHHGRTPPCTEALIAAGISRVVVGAVDPSPRMNGHGLAQLRAAGVAVDVADGALGYRARRQNDAFRKHAVRGLPFVTYKYAMTLDGHVATESGHSAWISGDESRLRVHQLRAEADAVLVGAGTLRADDPRLTARDVGAVRQPLRVVIDPLLRVAHEAALIASVGDGPVLLVCSPAVDPARADEVRSWGVEVMSVGPAPGGLAGSPPDPTAVARLLAERDVQALLLEGGPTLAAAWWAVGLIDRVLVFVAPILSGGRAAPGPLPVPGTQRMDEALRLRDVELGTSGADAVISGYLREPY